MNDRVFKTNLPTVRDTGPAKMPGLAVLPPTGNAALDTWARQITETVQVRDGARGNPWERNVTVREFASAVKVVEKMVPIAEALLGKSLDGGPMSGEASAMIDRFIKSIMDTKLYKDLMKRLDDPSRFDDLPAEIREILLSSIAEEARKRGADITRIEKKFQDANRSLAYTVETVTAAVNDAAGGVREVRWAVAEANHAQAGFISQVEASLGNYYQDGRPGRVLLEQQMYATADRVQGLSGQITFKLQAGGALAGWGLASSENTAGAQTSAFIVSADKFAVVLPTYAPPTRPVYERDADGNIVYVNGQPKVAYNQILAHEIPTNQGGVPFGIDQYGIYLNNNVYVRGNMRVEGTGGRTLIQGLRGSLILLQETGNWSDTQARNMVWEKLGNFGSAGTNNHLVIGDMVTIGTTTRYWSGAAWINPGTVFRGDMIVDGTLGASKINTHGLTIRNQYGQAVFTSGVDAAIPNWFVSGLGALATKNNVAAGDVSGLGALATQNWMSIGSDPGHSTQIRVDGTPIVLSDFISRFRKASKNNLVNFMDYAAIGSAFIGEAAIQTAHIDIAQIDTLRIGGKMVTVPKVFLGANVDVHPDAEKTLASGAMLVPAGSSGVLLLGNLSMSDYGADGQTYRWKLSFYRGGIKLWESFLAYGTHQLNYGTHSALFIDENPPAGNHTYSFRMNCIASSASHWTIVRDPVLVVMGAYR